MSISFNAIVNVWYTVPYVKNSIVYHKYSKLVTDHSKGKWDSHHHTFYITEVMWDHFKSGCLHDLWLQVAEGALRCFATLSDRFTRRSVDPEPLSKHGLVEELLKRLCAAGGPTNLNTSLPSGGGQTPDPKSSGRRRTVSLYKKQDTDGFCRIIIIHVLSISIASPTDQLYIIVELWVALGE